MEGHYPMPGPHHGVVTRSQSMILNSALPSRSQVSMRIISIPQTQDQDIPGSPSPSLSQGSPRSTQSRRENTIRSRRSLRSSSMSVSEHVGSEDRSILHYVKDILFSTRLNCLLVFFPLAIVADRNNWPHTSIFALSATAILPLAKLHDLISDEFNCRGKIRGTLLANTLGNAVEFILAICLLNQGKIEVVRISIVGSVVFKLLMVLGCSFFYGGCLVTDLEYKPKAAQTSISLMTMLYLLLLIPAGFKITGATIHQSQIQHMSYGMSIIILMVYTFYLVFHLKTHTHYYHHHWTTTDEPAPEESTRKEPRLPLPLAVAMFAIITGGVGYCADIMANSISGLSISWHTNPTFIGLIILPIVGNAVELVDAITLVKKKKMDLAIEVAIGSSMQTALFIAPMIVLVGWFMEQPITLFFAPFQTGVLFVSVLTVSHIIQDGKGDWLRGAILICSYFIVSVAMYCYPTTKL